MPETPTLQIEIKNAAPVELNDLAAALTGMGEEYQRWAASHEETALAGDLKLYVKEIRSGSIIGELVAYAPLALPFVEHANSLIRFSTYLIDCFNWLLGKKVSSPEALDAASLQNLSSIVEPVAKDAGGHVNINAINVSNVTGPVTITLNSMEANAVQNRAKREVGLLKTAVSETHSKVVLYWYQARNDHSSKAGDRAVIESISSSPVKALCVNESIKTKMIFESENPFTHAYVVDVSVETVRGKPALYRILDVIEKIDL